MKRGKKRLNTKLEHHLAGLHALLHEVIMGKNSNMRILDMHS